MSDGSTHLHHERVVFDGLPSLHRPDYGRIHLDLPSLIELLLEGLLLLSLDPRTARDELDLDPGRLGGEGLVDGELVVRS